MIAKVSALALFANEPPISHVQFTNDDFRIVMKGGAKDQIVRARDIRHVKAANQALHAKLTVTTHSGLEHSIGGLNRKEAESLTKAITTATRRHRDTAKADAERLSKSINSTELKVRQLLSQPQYLRHTTTVNALKKIVRSTTSDHGYSEEFITQKAKEALTNMRELIAPAGMEEVTGEANEEFVTEQVAQVKAASYGITEHGLTSEQARAIATDEEVTLVLAGAGTGKTTITIGKLAYLLRHQRVPPEKILVLSFNRDAAAELRNRLPKDLEATKILTFHAYGLQIIAAHKEAPTISRMAQDHQHLRSAIKAILTELLENPETENATFDLLANMPGTYKAPFDFSTEEGYTNYIHEIELRTLSGDLVNSFEELELANWLTQNGVRFEYERAYPIKTANHQRRQYLPDFWLSDYDIYIEHFALNEAGAAPPGWTGYEDGVNWKRDIHLDHKTKLIETYSWQHRQNILLPTLAQKLNQEGVEFNPIPKTELIAKLGSTRTSPMENLLSTFLDHAKSGNLAHDLLMQRAQTAPDLKRAETFLKVFKKAREHYENLLSSEEALDFHDLINQATRIIEQNPTLASYTHILVDEFQDISSGRMELLKALRKDSTAYFLVGDDWQSIYRFTGSNVDLVKNVPQYLGYTKTENLSQTFRFGKGILDPSSHFIQQNPQQTQRTLQPNPNVMDKGITIVPSNKPTEGLQATVKDLAKSEDYKQDDDIMALGRYNNTSAAVKTLGPKARKKINFTTIHRSKGQEAAYIIIMDLNNSMHGFPCRIEDDPLLNLVMPPGQEVCEHAEERRLFYVALTRAKKGVYLITDEAHPSPFVRELLETPGHQIRQLKELRPQCPRCLNGTLTEARSRTNLRCSNHPRCGYLSPLCPDCKTGFIKVVEREAYCSNQNCTAVQMICPRCRQGILVKRVRQSDNSPFLGCTRFSEEPPCRHTER